MSSIGLAETTRSQASMHNGTSNESRGVQTPEWPHPEYEDPDWTSSSGSSSSVDEEGEEDDNDDEQDGGEGHLKELPSRNPASAPQRPKVNQDVRARIAQLLPQMRKANEKLKDQDIKSRQIDDVSDDEERYIEMDLGLGVLTQNTGNEDIKIPAADGEEIDSGDKDDEDENENVPLTSDKDEPNIKATARRNIIEEL